MRIQDRKLNEYTKFMKKFMDTRNYHECKMVNGKKRFFPRKQDDERLGKNFFTKNNFASINNENWLHHVSGNKTFGYNNNQKNKGQLICIDLDPKDKHCLANEQIFRKCMERINKFFNTFIFWERSTNYKNYHGYLIFNKERTDTDSFCEELEKLEQILSDLCPELERVELLGRPTNYIYDYAGILHDIKHQTPVKIPRDYQRIDEMLQIGSIEIDDLWKMTDGYKQKKKQLKSGSGKEFDLSFLNTNVMQTMQELTASIFSNEIKLKGRKVVFDDLLACFLVSFVQTKNKFTKTSVNNAERVWNTLKENGWIERGFDNNRWAVCRNILSQNGLINWKEHEYTPPKSYSNTGEELKGKCCVYSLTEEIMTALDTTGGGRPRDFKNIPKLGQFLIPIRKKGIFFVSSSPDVPIWESDLGLSG